ncbi:MAG TPA: HAD family hydrolase [Kofleriaceae bacterium]
MSIRYVILDFDGTCTQIEAIQREFVEAYRIGVGASAADWTRALATVRDAAPTAGWTLFDQPSTAPANADPYILTFEAARLLVREGVIGAIDPMLFGRVYAKHPAPFRPELREVLLALLGKGIAIAFVSNSAKDKVAAAVDKAMGDEIAARGKIHVIGNAAKMMIGELPTGTAIDARAVFETLPAAQKLDGVNRPVYLRRANYFRAICDVFTEFKATGFPADELLVCGDIWELDLAMPRALGANVHLIQRTPPFDTNAYELAQMRPGETSTDLHALLARV